MHYKLRLVVLCRAFKVRQRGAYKGHSLVSEMFPEWEGTVDRVAKIEVVEKVICMW